MCAAYAVEKCGFSRAFEIEDLRDRAIEQLAIGGKNILGVGIAVSDLCNWDHRVSCSGLSTEISKIAER